MCGIIHKNLVYIPLLIATEKMKNGCYNPLRGLDRGLFFETVDNDFRCEKRIDKLSYKRLMCVPGKTVSSLKCSHYNSGVIGVQVTLQNTHWKGGA